MMKKSSIFGTEVYKEIEIRIGEFLNSEPDFLGKSTANSPRAVGDAMQSILSENFDSILGKFCKEYSSDFARRAMADLAFTDTDNLYYRVDVKTHRTDTHFNMPNLTSVERLARFYEDDNNYFVVLMIKYTLNKTKVDVGRVHFVPIEFLSWDCLTIGNLGWGQIQIANANTVNIAPGYSRRDWMLELCDTMLQFYPKEIEKTNRRIEYFNNVKALWSGKPKD
jgi:hypothetical protein